MSFLLKDASLSNYHKGISLTLHISTTGWLTEQKRSLSHTFQSISLIAWGGGGDIVLMLLPSPNICVATSCVVSLDISLYNDTLPLLISDK